MTDDAGAAAPQSGRVWSRLLPSGRLKAVAFSEAEEVSADIVDVVCEWVDRGRPESGFPVVVQAVSRLAFGTAVVTCRHCGWVYVAGHKTGRGRDGVYCTEACRKAAWRACQLRPVTED